MSPYSISEFTSAFFDTSSEAWRSNKVRVGPMFTYRCEYIHSNGKRCPKAIIPKQKLDCGFLEDCYKKVNHSTRFCHRHRLSKQSKNL